MSRHEHSVPEIVQSQGRYSLADYYGNNPCCLQERRKRVLSGVQPTGTLHLGNYLGVRNIPCVKRTMSLDGHDVGVDQATQRHTYSLD